MKRFLLAASLFIAFIAHSNAEILSAAVDRPPLHQPQSLTPVILIPGTTRTKLARGKDGPIVWGNFRNFFSIHSDGHLALPIESTNLRENRDDLIPQALVEKFTIIPFFLSVYTHQKFLKRMEDIGGYRLGNIDEPKRGNNFFVFLYDWRRNSQENAERLAQKIENLKVFFGSPSIKFDIIAHSSAVYMARYYALYGDQDVLGAFLDSGTQSNPAPTHAGAKNIRKLILVSPPHRGTVLAFQVLHKGFRPLPLPFVKSYSAYEFFTLPAFFEMLPPSGERFFIDENGNNLDIDLYDPSNWVRYGWSVFSKKEQGHLARKYRQLFPSSWREKVAHENEKRFRYLEAVLRRTKAFHEAINEETKIISPSVDAYSFIFTGSSTLDRVEFSKEEGRLRFKSKRQTSLRYSPGDGMVTNASMHGRYQAHKPKEIFIREKHRRMANSRLLHLKLIELLLGKEEQELS